MAETKKNQNSTKKSPPAGRSAQTNAAVKKDRAPASEKKAAPAKRAEPAQGKKEEPAHSSSPSRAKKILSQILPYVLVLLSVFLIVCFLTFDPSGKTNPYTGIIGNGLCKLAFGLFSGAAYLMPLLALLYALFWKHDFGFPVGKGERAIWGTLFLLFTAADIHAIAFLNHPELKAFGVGFLWEQGVNRVGGGVLGGLLGTALLNLVGKVGSLLIGIAVAILFALFFFGLTPHTIYVWIAFSLHENRERRQEQKEAREEKLAQIEEERRARAKEKRERELERQQEQERRRAEADLEQKRKPYVDEEPIGTPSGNTGSGSGQNAPGVYEHVKPIIGPKKKFVPVDEDDTDVPHEVALTGSGPEENGPFDFPENDPADEKTGHAEDEESIYAPDFTMNGGKKPPLPQKKQEPDPTAAAGQEKTAVKKPAGTEDEVIDLEAIFTDPEGNDVIEKFQEEQRRRELEAKVKRDLDEHPVTGAAGDENQAEYDLAIRRLSALTGTEPAKELVETPVPEKKPYQFPPVTLMKLDPAPVNEDVSEELHSNGVKLVETLRSFKVRTKIVNISRGPTITRYELTPEEGVRVRQIANLVDDIALNLATSGVRIEAPIPGKSAVGIEVPNKNVATVFLRELIDTPKFKNAPSLITACLGKDVAGDPIYFDIAKMPHLLIAGATGMGKSVCMNSIIVSLLYKASPDDVKLMLIDPKKVEMNIYNGLPHLLVPVVSDPKKAAGALHWAVTEMERRYELIEGMGVRDLKNYNKAIEGDPKKEHLPQIVILIDELADLMMTASDDVETSICRLAQKARAAGMHLIIGTQRPSVDVITGLIKANVPSRIAFTVSQQMDSRVILDMVGAEKLIGRGDMLYAPVGASKPIRVQGAFVSEGEVEDIVSFIKDHQGVTEYSGDIMESIEKEAARCGSGKHGSGDAPADGTDEGEADNMLKPAIELALEAGKISTSLIQRRLSLGYGRAAKLIDKMERLGIVSPPEGQKPRSVLITREQYMEMVLDHDEELG